MQELIDYREYDENNTRGGVTGHNVRYVLLASLAIAIVGLTASALIL
jgi:hypothetical protein